MPITKLPRVGFWTDLKTGSSGWGPNRNYNSTRMEQVISATIIGQVATSTALPVSPTDGDQYYVQDTQFLATYLIYDGQPGQWFQDYTPRGLPIYNSTTDAWFYFDGTSLVPWPGGGGGVVPPNYQISATSGLANTTSTTPVDMTNLTVTITSIGNPINVYLVTDQNPAATSRVGIRNMTPDGAEAKGYIHILRNAVIVATFPMYLFRVTGSVGQSMWLQIPCSCIMLKDVIVAGTYTYSIQANVDGVVDTDQLIEVSNCKLVAEEPK